MMAGPILFYIIFDAVDCYMFKSDLHFNGTHSNFSIVKSINSGRFSEYWDWRDMNVVSTVKDQRNCNACWAFSALATIESHLMIYSGTTEQLSEQFLIDCDSSGVGCTSASVLKAFVQIVTHLGGVLRRSDYKPYADRQLPCSWNGYPTLVPVIGFQRVQSDEEVMAKYVYKYGPLSAGINSASMKVYKGGIDEPTDDVCSPGELDHAVSIVGYNVYVNMETGKRVPYWIIKNSWGTSWGDQGYYYLARGRNACGIANDVSFAILSTDI